MKTDWDTRSYDYHLFFPFTSERDGCSDIALVRNFSLLTSRDVRKNTQIFVGTAYNVLGMLFIISIIKNSNPSNACLQIDMKWTADQKLL